MEFDNNNDWRSFFKSDKGDALGWGIVFLWGAIVLLMDVSTVMAHQRWWDGWAVFFTGFGLIALVGAIIAMQIGDNEKAGWNFFFGFIMLGFGLGTIVNSEVIWVVILLAIAVVLIYGSLLNRSETIESNNVNGV